MTSPCSREEENPWIQSHSRLLAIKVFNPCGGRPGRPPASTRIVAAQRRAPGRPGSGGSRCRTGRDRAVRDRGSTDPTTHRKIAPGRDTSGTPIPPARTGHNRTTVWCPHRPNGRGGLRSSHGRHGEPFSDDHAAHPDRRAGGASRRLRRTGSRAPLGRHVAGAAALVWQAFPDSTPDSVLAFLQQRAKKLSGADADPNVGGAGRVDLGLPPGR